MKNLLLIPILLIPLYSFSQFDTAFVQDFENSTIGQYNETQRAIDFGSSPHVTRVDSCEIESNNDGINNSRIFDASYPYGERLGNTGFNWWPTIDDDDEWYYTFKIKFNKNFHWTEGGKIAGMHSYAGDDDDFIGLLMFKEAGALISYTWEYSSTSNLESDYWDYHFQSDKWYTVTYRISLDNWGSDNGILEGFVNDTLVMQLTGRALKRNSDDILDRFRFESFTGGDTDNYNAQRNEHVDFDDLWVWKYDDTTTTEPIGHTASDPGRVLTNTPYDLVYTPRGVTKTEVKVYVNNVTSAGGGYCVMKVTGDFDYIGSDTVDATGTYTFTSDYDGTTIDTIYVYGLSPHIWPSFPSFGVDSVQLNGETVVAGSGTSYWTDTPAGHGSSSSGFTTDFPNQGAMLFPFDASAPALESDTVASWDTIKVNFAYSTYTAQNYTDFFTSDGEIDLYDIDDSLTGLTIENTSGTFSSFTGGEASVSGVNTNASQSLWYNEIGGNMTFRGLDADSTYKFILLASRDGQSGDTARFKINNDSVDIVTNDNTTLYSLEFTGADTCVLECSLTSGSSYFHINSIFVIIGNVSDCTGTSSVTLDGNTATLTQPIIDGNLTNAWYVNSVLQSGETGLTFTKRFNYDDEIYAIVTSDVCPGDYQSNTVISKVEYGIEGKQIILKSGSNVRIIFTND